MLAAVAAALALWSLPANLSSAHQFVDSPALAFAADGTGLATWWADGESDGAVLGGREHRLASGLVSAPVAYATSRMLAVTQRQAGGGKVTLSAIYGRGAEFGAPRVIATRANLRNPVLAVNASGAAAVVWFEDRGVSNDRVYVAERRASGAFGTPQLLATDRVRSVSVAISARGDVLVAWDARGTIKTRSKAKTAFGPVQALASQPTYYAALRTAIASSGRAYVAWGAQRLTEGGDRGPVYYEAAVRPAGTARFRAAQLLEQQSDRQVRGGLDLVVDDGSRATVAWTGWDGTHYRVRAASTDQRAVFGPAQDVSPPGEDDVEAALAGAPDGRALVAWVRELTDAPAGAIGAALAPAGGPFGAPEVVSPGPEARVPAAAFDGHADRFALDWSNRPNGEARPIATYLQWATR